MISNHSKDNIMLFWEWIKNINVCWFLIIYISFAIPGTIVKIMIIINKNKNDINLIYLDFIMLKLAVEIFFFFSFFCRFSHVLLKYFFFSPMKPYSINQIHRIFIMETLQWSNLLLKSFLLFTQCPLHFRPAKKKKIKHTSN